ncbi:MAG: aspartate-semialdehyde dehydrogenase [Candidatus Sumerlaeia bacterium]
MEKLRAGVIGATGMVGQNYIRLLKGHPWFEVSFVAASPRSAGKKYSEAVAGRWLMEEDMPEKVAGLTVADASDVDAAKGACDFVFSAVEISKEEVRELEDKYAAAGIPVVSNNSAHRHTDDVPMLIPEINGHHVDMIPEQRRLRGWDQGLVVVKPNCSLQSYITPVFALIQAGYGISEMVIATLQAVSGAGYPGVPSLDMIDNVVPYIGGEEEKSELEPQKILGEFKDGAFQYDKSIKISAHCNRVPVVDGHTACVSLRFADKKPSIEEVKAIWSKFQAEPQKMDLPFAPKQPIILREEADRPQPRRDRNADKAMAVSVGRIRPCNTMDLRFVGLSHNTVRGAAGGGILNAEWLKAKGYLG